MKIITLFFIAVCLVSEAAAQVGENVLRLGTERDTAEIWKEILAAREQVSHSSDSAGEQLSKLLEQSLQQRYHRGIIASYLALGNLMARKGLYNKSLYNLKTGLRHCDTQQDGGYIALFYNNIGAVYQYLADYPKAAENFRMAIAYAAQSPPDHMSIENIYNNYGTVFLRLGLYGKALEQFKKALHPGDAPDSLATRTGAMINMASAYKYLQQDSIAILYLEQAVVRARQHRQYTQLHTSLTNLAEWKLKQGQSKEALRLLLEAREVERTFPINTSHKNTVLANIGIIYLSLGRLKEAEEHLTRAYQSKDMLPVERKNILGQLSQLYAQKKDFEKAHFYLQEYHELADSLRSNDVILRVSELEQKYRTAEKDKEIITSKWLIARQKNRLAHKNLWITGISSAALLVIGIVIASFLLRNRRNNNRRAIERLQSLIVGEENERGRLAKDLHDGVNSRLNAIKIHLLALQKNQQSEYINKGLLTDINVMLQEASDEIKTVSQNLTPNAIVHNGLRKSLNYFCEKAFSHAEVITDIQLYNGIDDIPQELALSIYRIVQELVQNVLKHAKASSFILMLYKDNKKVVLLTEDDGIGLASRDIKQLSTKGMGWQNIRDRVTAHQGTLHLEPGKENKGLVTTIEFPLA